MARMARMAVRRAAAAATAGCACLAPMAAIAHAPDIAASGTPRLDVTPEPGVVASMLVALALYVAGYVRLRARRGAWQPAAGVPGVAGSPHRAGADAPDWDAQAATEAASHRTRANQLTAFLLGWTALAIALASPLDALGGMLFSAHMVQHEMLMIVAAPLLVMGRPLAVWLWAFPRRWRRPVARAWRWGPLLATWRLLTGAAAAWLLHAAALWLWHVPRFFQAALADATVHAWQHASFLGTALLFWWPIFGRPRHAAPGGYGMLSLFTTMVHTGALGALLTLAPGIWYPAYVETSGALGIDPLRDQQLGGLVMWVPGGLAYLVAALWLGWRWLSPPGGPGIRGAAADAGPGLGAPFDPPRTRP